MQTFNAITSAIFKPVLGWFGSYSGLVDIVFWSLLGGVVALMVYKVVSNQKGIEKAKNDIKVHLMEIRLFQDDLLGVLASTCKILGKNVLYIGHNIMPMVVMFVPMMAILFQLEAHYAFDPIEPGTQQILTLKLDREVTDVMARDITLETPAGIVLAAPMVPAVDEAAWLLDIQEPGDHVLTIRVGDEVIEKGVAVGGEPRRVPYLRTKTWEGYLYPGEQALDSDSAVKEVRLKYPERELPIIPGGELGIMASFLVLSLAVGFAMKGVFGVTL